MLHINLNFFLNRFISHMLYKLKLWSWKTWVLNWIRSIPICNYCSKLKHGRRQSVTLSHSSDGRWIKGCTKSSLSSSFWHFFLIALVKSPTHVSCKSHQVCKKQDLKHLLLQTDKTFRNLDGRLTLISVTKILYSKQ